MIQEQRASDQPENKQIKLDIAFVIGDSIFYNEIQTSSKNRWPCSDEKASQFIDTECDNCVIFEQEDSSSLMNLM